MWLHISRLLPGPTQLQHRHANPDPQTWGSGAPSPSVLGIFEALGRKQAQPGIGGCTRSLADSVGLGVGLPPVSSSTSVLALRTSQHRQWTLQGHLTTLGLLKRPCILALS